MASLWSKVQWIHRARTHWDWFSSPFKRPSVKVGGFGGQSPLHIDEINDPLPDFAVVPGGPRDYAGVHPTTAALVVKISDTTLRTDLTEKAERYATAGIADYWVLDLNANQLHVLRDPQPLPRGLGTTAYKTHLTFGPTDTISPLAVPNAVIQIGDLLP